jgi:hypothetical protein
MSAVAWVSLMRLLRCPGARDRRSRNRFPKGRRTAPRIESLELISLLRSVGPPAIDAVRSHRAGHHRHATPDAGQQPAGDVSMATVATPQTLPAQTISLGDTLTNFTSLPLSPSLNLFDPSLGTLISAAVNQSSALQSTITSRNLSPTSATIITATHSGGYQISGLNQPIVRPTETQTGQPVSAGTFGSSTDTVMFPNLQISQPSSTVFSDPASLAFFTASSGRATITPTMTASGSGSASAPNGNLFTIARTSASATVTVSYTYLPAPASTPSPTSTPPPTPTPNSYPTTGKIGRIGVHHQRTLLILPFQGAVNPVLAGTRGDYFVTTATGEKIRIVLADYNPATNSVTLSPARRLNVHDRFTLTATLPCPDGIADDVLRIPFGSKYFLTGFHDKGGQFVPVRDGRIVRSDRRPRHEDRHGLRR